MPRHAQPTASLTVFAALAALPGLFACGDDDGDRRPRFTVEITGADGSTTVASLDPGAQRELCQSYDVFVESHVDLGAVAYLSCLPPALVFGGSREGCEEQLDECIELFPEPVEIRASAETDEICIGALSSCRASVTDLEGCININLDLLFEILDDWSCALYGDEQVQAQAERMMEDVLQVCADIDTSCNRFADPLRPE